MTANQINYAKQREEARHNLVAESISHRQATASEMQGTAALRQADTARASFNEQARHNREGESINWFQQMESRRHNQAQEAVQNREADTHVGQLSESIRHNKVSESQKTLELDNLKRYQEGQVEAALQSSRAAMIGANASQRSSQAALMNAAANQAQVGISSGVLSESIRNNRAQLAETSRHNIILETQGATANTIRGFEASTGRRNAETNKYNAITKRGDVIATNINTAFKTVSDNTSRLASSIIGGALR